MNSINVDIPLADYLKMPYNQRKKGKFCCKSTAEKYKHVKEANKRRNVNIENERNITHDHSYDTVLSSNTENICDQRVNLYEEEIGVQKLPASVVSVDTYRLVVELQIIINQLKSGCKNCRLPLNLCSVQGVLPRGLGGWLYISCDNPACELINKIAVGKQHQWCNLEHDSTTKTTG